MSINLEGKLIYDETRRIIREAKGNKRLALFVGAGVSMDSGMPSWNQAVSQIAAKLPLTDKDKPYDSLKIPQYYYNSRGKKEYTQLMRDVFLYGKPLQTNPLHKKIMECQVETIITTNYDHLIEQASEENAEVRYVISKDSDLPYKNTSRELIKMHGDFENDNFVLKEDDYLQYSDNFRLIETYIKSLIGTKVILFVGYSLNDPDVKQIFTWAKNILREDFQRAYLVLSGKGKNEIERSYFRNIGVNIIYTSELVDEWEKKKHSEQLEEFFDYIFGDEKEKVLDRVYNELKPLLNLNYVYGKYIRNALWWAGISCEGDKISLLRNVRSEDDENEKLKQLLWVYISDENAEELYCLDGSDRDKLKTIKNVLNKSSFKYLIREEENGSYSKVQLDENNSDEIEESVYKFDYKRLDSIKNHNVAKLNSDFPDLYMQQAYIAVLLNDYYAAYNCLKNAGKIYYRNKNFVWYFLAEFNRKYVGKICVDVLWSEISPEERLQLDTEVKAIDLEQILATIPDMDHKHNAFLSELSSFKIAYNLFYDMFDNSLKVNEQAKTAYALFAGTAAYEKLRANAKDYNDYETRNYIMLDRCNEVRSIFLLYLRSILSSVMADDISDLSSDEGAYRTGNIKEDQLKPFDFYIMLRYLSQADIKKLFKEYDIKILPADEESLQYIEEIADSMIEAGDYVKNNVFYGDYFWTYLELISHVSISIQLAMKVLKRLSAIENEYEFRIHSESIDRFVTRLDKKEYYQNKGIIKLVTKIIDNLLDAMIGGSVKQLELDIIWNLSYVCKKNGKSYDNIEKIDKLISAYDKLFFAKLYDNFGKNCQKLILEQFDNWKPENNADDYSLYCNAVLVGIIKPDVDIERQIFAWMDKIESEKKGIGNVSVKVVSGSKEPSDVMRELVDLLLNGQILDSEGLRKRVECSGEAMSKWLMDISGFDYSAFDCNWLGCCSSGLLRRIAQDEVANKCIRRVYKEQYESKTARNGISNIIIKYFITAPEKI